MDCVACPGRGTIPVVIEGSQQDKPDATKRQRGETRCSVDGAVVVVDDGKSRNRQLTVRRMIVREREKERKRDVDGLTQP